jgi:hypothetical protein
MIGRSSEFNENKLDSRISIFVGESAHIWLRYEKKLNQPIYYIVKTFTKNTSNKRRRYGC